MTRALFIRVLEKRFRLEPITIIHAYRAPLPGKNGELSRVLSHYELMGIDCSSLDERLEWFKIVRQRIIAGIRYCL